MNRPLSFNTAKELLPFGVILVTMALSWGTIITQLSLLNQKIDIFIAQAKEQNLANEKRFEKHEEDIRRIDKDVTRHDTTIEDAKKRGLLSQKTESTLARAMSIPTPAAQSAQPTVINNYSEEEPEQTQSTPAPTSSTEREDTPTPTPSPTSTVCVIGVCI